MQLFTLNRRWIFAPLIILLLPAGLLADHIVGGEFSYECLGFKDGDPDSGMKTYEITINMYRDCIGTGAWFDGDDAGCGRPKPSAQ